MIDVFYNAEINNYRPNGPGQGKIAIRYKSLSDSSFLAYLRSKTPDLLRPIRLVP